MQIRNYLRDYLKKNFKIVPDYNETEFVMDNFVDDETKQRLLENVDGRAGAKIGEIIQNARETEKFVSEDIEGNEQMSKEERQILFHKLMIENRSVREDVKKGKTNFDNYDLMSGGVNAGLETKSKKETVPVVDTPQQVVEVQNVVVNTDTSIGDGFSEFISKFQSMLAQFSSLKTELKNLERKTVKQLKVVEKLNNKKKT